MGLNIAGIWYKDRLGSLHLFPSQCLTSMPRPKQKVYKVCTSKGKRKKKKIEIIANRVPCLLPDGLDSAYETAEYWRVITVLLK